MNIWLSVLLMALFQGVTEFLPVSSSGHLMIAGRIFGLEATDSFAFSIILHAGSLLAIVVFYFKVLLGFFRKDQLHLLGMVVLGSVPAGIAGILLKKSGLADRLFDDLIAVGFALLITGAVLRLTGKKKLTANAVTELKSITVRQTLIIGFAQMFAIAPGISRSGSTIAAGILSGVRFEAAATFSFLLALPAIGGATLLELLDLVKADFSPGVFTPAQLAVGFLVSAVTSFGALSLLVLIVRRQKLSAFSWYVTIVGLAVIGWQLIQMGKR